MTQPLKCSDFGVNCDFPKYIERKLCGRPSTIKYLSCLTRFAFPLVLRPIDFLTLWTAVLDTHRSSTVRCGSTLTACA